MSKQEDTLAEDFDLTDEVTSIAESADAETLITYLEDRFSSSAAPLEHIPMISMLRVSSIEIILAGLLNIDDSTVTRLSRLARESLSIKVNSILLGKAGVMMVNERYGLRMLEFNTRDINDLVP